MVSARSAVLSSSVAPAVSAPTRLRLPDLLHASDRSADDVLWRRTKLGLHLSPEQRERVALWWQDRYTPEPHNTGDARVRSSTWS